MESSCSRVRRSDNAISVTDEQVKLGDVVKAARKEALPELSDVIALTCSKIGLRAVGVRAETKDTPFDAGSPRDHMAVGSSLSRKTNRNREATQGIVISGIEVVR